ncbi:MAG TPA: PhzF family phenazine biosynthesis isomerase [Longimicrobium sp.]|nr:PhzF family phenazine biosynthesis isomerase [Longimicrobium sp.]
MRVKYHTLDVFTDRVFGGNPLAVFPDADAVPPALMQRIARELNLSETVFVLWEAPPEGTDCRVRIFTPASELPFAGHPTVGTAYLLAMLGRLKAEGGAARVVLGEGVGPVPVEVRMEDGRPAFAVLSAALLPEPGPPPWRSCCRWMRRTWADRWGRRTGRPACPFSSSPCATGRRWRACG